MTHPRRRMRSSLRAGSLATLNQVSTRRPFARESNEGLRILENHGERRDEGSSSLHAGRSDRCTSLTRVASEKHAVSSNILHLRTLLNVEAAENSHDSCHDASDCNTCLHGASDHNIKEHDLIYPDTQGRQAAISAQRSSLSMRASMQTEDKQQAPMSRPAFTQHNNEDFDSLSSSMASKSFCVQLEEIKPSRKKAWSFSPGKVSDNVVVMFPNPTYDTTTPPTSMPPDVEPSINGTIQEASPYEEVSTFPSTTMMYKAPLDNKACTQKREKIVRLSPCSTSSNAQKLKPPPASTIDVASASTNASPRKQKWKCTLTHPPSPTLIRRLPEAHEMQEIKQNGVTSTISAPNVFVGRLQYKDKGDEEDRHTLANVNYDDDVNSKTRKKSWSFGSPFVVENTSSSSDTRRSSFGPSGGGHSFSFLSRHFHAWKSASKQDK